MGSRNDSNLPTGSVIDAIRPENRVIEQEVSLHRFNGTIKATMMMEGCKHAGIDLNDPGTRKSFYHHDTGLLIIDLGGDFSEVDGDDE